MHERPQKHMGATKHRLEKAAGGGDVRECVQAQTRACVKAKGEGGRVVCGMTEHTVQEVKQLERLPGAKPAGSRALGEQVQTLNVTLSIQQ